MTSDNEMNNQAAQTMPELPEPELMTHLGREGYTADQVHQYARDYAAALSQTAGVAEGFVIAPREPTPAMVAAWRSSIPDDSCSYHANDETWAAWCSESWNAMLAAAPAASGGECHKPCTPIDFFNGDACPDCVTRDYSPNPPSAASVSERVRKLTRFGLRYHKGLGASTITARPDGNYIIRDEALRAIEQALTQQRGHDDGDGDPMTVLEAYAQGVNDALAGKHGAGSDPVMYQQIHRHLPNAQWTECSKSTFDQYTNYHRQYGGEPPVRALYTTPQPSADAVRESVSDGWRAFDPSNPPPAGYYQIWDAGLRDPSRPLIWSFRRVEFGAKWGKRKKDEMGWHNDGGWLSERAPSHYKPLTIPTADELESLLSAASGEKAVG